MNRVQKVWASLKQVDVNDYIGEPGELFFDFDTGTLRKSDNTTPGGIPVVSSTATANFQTTEPDTPVNGEIWYDPNTSNLSVYDAGAWTQIGGANNVNDLTDISTINIQNNDILVFNSANQVFENKAINLTGGLANQVLVKQTDGDYDYQWEDMIIQLPETTYTKLLDQASETVLYFGEAAPDSLEASAVWRIQKILFDTSGNVLEVRYAAGGNFDQIWDDRTILTYA